MRYTCFAFAVRWVGVFAAIGVFAGSVAAAEHQPDRPYWLWSTAHTLPIDGEVELLGSEPGEVIIRANGDEPRVIVFDVLSHEMADRPQEPDEARAVAQSSSTAYDGTVWRAVLKTVEGRQLLHLLSENPDGQGVIDHGPIAIGNPDYMTLTDEAGKVLPEYAGVRRIDHNTLIPTGPATGITAHEDDTIYLTTNSPATLHAVRLPSVAAIVTEYRENSHADVIVTRLIETDTLDGKGQRTSVSLASLYTDQVPDNDTSRAFAAKHGFPIFEEVADTITLGGNELAVNGILLVAEHGDYPMSELGQRMYPKRRLFEQIVQTMDRIGARGVPVFVDKHLADTWEDAKWIYDEAQRLEMPLMAGSSLPVLWRFPAVDLERDAKVEEIFAISYHTLDAYGFHALEMIQCLVERRAGGETGVRSVQCLTGDAVWEAGEAGVYDAQLLDAALARMQRTLPADRTLAELTPEPVLFVIEYNDGLRASVLTLRRVVNEWTVAWRYEDEQQPIKSTLFWTQEARPFMHFSYLLQGIEQMIHTGRPTWPAERTLLTSGMLDALLISRANGGERLETPHLNIEYQSDWNWHQPPLPTGVRAARGRDVTWPSGFEE